MELVEMLRTPMVHRMAVATTVVTTPMVVGIKVAETTQMVAVMQVGMQIPSR